MDSVTLLGLKTCRGLYYLFLKKNPQNMDGNISSSANLQNNTFFIKDKFQFNYLILRLTGVLAFCHNRSTQYICKYILF